MSESNESKATNALSSTLAGGKFFIIISHKQTNNYYLDTTHRSGITFRSPQISHPFLIQFTPYFVHDT